MLHHLAPQRAGEKGVSAREEVEMVRRQALPGEVAALRLVHDAEPRLLRVDLSAEALRRHCEVGDLAAQILHVAGRRAERGSRSRVRGSEERGERREERTKMRRRRRRREAG